MRGGMCQRYAQPALLAIGLKRIVGRQIHLCGTSLISILHPTASAYLLIDDKDGACFPADSRRDTVLFEVPIRVATAS
jgi:hypothetical protein